MKPNLKAVLFSLLVLSLITVLVYSCKKEEPDTESQSSVDNSIAEGEFSRIFPEMNHIAVGDSGVQRWIFNSHPNSACPDYWVDSADAVSFPVTLWLSYGYDSDGDSIYETGCPSNDGKMRKGMIKAVFDAPWNSPGSSVTMTLKNYYVNGIKFEGTISVTRSSNSFTHSVSNGKASTGSWTILWNSSRTLTSFMGDTATINDDYCDISGSASGTDRKGRNFSVNISTPLRRKMGCIWIVSGVQTMTPDGLKERTIDFGNGTCDNKATLIIDGNHFEFDLE